MDVLQVEQIRKSFGEKLAVNDLSITVGQGKIFGLLGPNGAGKTTTIRMITNIIAPDSGRVLLFGNTMNAEMQNRIGYLPEERGLYKKIKVIEQLVYFAQLKGVKYNDAIEQARKWLRKFDASDWENKKVQELSKGMQQKVQFISTILHNPGLLILDEPFSGFDPINTEVLKKIIIDLKNEGITIILSTHIMEQVEQLCDEICLINSGNILLAGKVVDIKSGYGRDTVLMEFDGDDSFLNEFSNLTFINRSSNRVEFRIADKSNIIQTILEKAVKNVTLYKLELNEPSLHEIFIDVVSKKGNNNEK